MVLPLIWLAATLVSKKLQDDQQKRAYLQQIGREEAQTKAAIEARRAARAGDSGYMQAAMGAAGNFSLPPRSSAGPMLQQVGSALASQRDTPASKAADAAESSRFDTEDTVVPEADKWDLDF